MALPTRTQNSEGSWPPLAGLANTGQPEAATLTRQIVLPVTSANRNVWFEQSRTSDRPTLLTRDAYTTNALIDPSVEHDDEERVGVQVATVRRTQVSLTVPLLQTMGAGKVAEGERVDDGPVVWPCCGVGEAGIS